jgi:hypothetical protein
MSQQQQAFYGQRFPNSLTQVRLYDLEIYLVDLKLMFSCDCFNSKRIPLGQKLVGRKFLLDKQLHILY